ncbi:MAG TPA: patatin-like phospholipase family protein [Polyangiales bacterium]|nr:patatin-like phospholipase family protein [Polyangiales bacterium]
MTKAFVLSGGGSLGAVQVGMLKALAENDIHPDLIIGTSVGALNGVFLAGRAGREGVAELAEVWRSLRRHDVFPIGPFSGALGYYGLRNWLVRPTPLEALIRNQMRFDRLEAAPVPLHVVATEIMSGAEVLLSRGDTVSAILASAAIPGVFPPVEIEGRALVDGGVANNTPISHALALGATTIYVLPAGYACTLQEAPKSALGMALQALTILIGRGLAFDIERYDGRYALHVVPPLCPLDVTPTDFSRADELIERAYRSTIDWLGSDAVKAAPLAQVHGVRPHSHA